MSQKDVFGSRSGVAAGSVITAAIVVGFALAALAPAYAQDPAAKAAPAEKAPAAAKDGAAAPAAKDGGKQSAWVKLCDKVPIAKRDKDGKETKEEKNICMTLHDRIEANTGLTLVSVSLRQIEGQEKVDLQVGVPLGMILPAGIRVAVLSKEQTDKLMKKEEIDPKTVKTVEMKYATCLYQGCTAEIEAPPDLVEQIKGADALFVRAVHVDGKQFGVPVPLSGFAEALAGKPVDNDEYKKARGQLMAQIRQRQAEAYEKFKAEQMKNLPPPPPDAAPAAKGEAPAEKK